LARPKKNPLIQALIAELPDAGTEWPVEKQIGWINMMTMAFGIVYGGDAAQQMTAKSDAQDVKPVASQAKFDAVKKPKVASYEFIIDEGGYVRNGKTSEQLSPSDVAGKTVYDMRGMDGDMSSLIWADGSKGLNGADINISSV
jgi:hypothetical protein